MTRKPMTEKECLSRLEAGEAAIDLAIEKWERLAEQERITLADINGKSCALCQVNPENCDECPLFLLGDFCSSQTSSWRRVWRDIRSAPYHHLTHLGSVKRMISLLRQAKEYMAQQAPKRGRGGREMPNERNCPWCGQWFWDNEHECEAPTPSCPICGEDGEFSLGGPNYCQECRQSRDAREGAGDENE